MIHDDAHPLAGKTVKVDFSKAPHPQLNGTVFDFEVEDWWDRVNGKPWAASGGSPAAVVYALRIGMAYPDVPPNDDVVYGKIGPYGHLVHVTELGDAL